MLSSERMVGVARLRWRGAFCMFDFLKGIIIFITTITLPISGLFVHSKPVVKTTPTPTPTISISISPTPKKLTPAPNKQIIEDENSYQYNSVPNTPTSNAEVKQEAKHIISISPLTSTPTPIPFKGVITTTPQIIIPTSIPTPAKTNTNDYSDYIFGYTYAGEVSPSSKMKILQFSATSRDLRLARAIFRISNEDAEKYDSMDSSKYSHTTMMWFCKNSCRNYTLERTDKNTFLYVGSRTSGLQIAQGHIYVEIQIPTFAEGFITDISLPMSEWEIWDNSTGKMVKTQ